MSHNQNTKLMEQFLDECTMEWRCPYCGGPVAEEWPVCCKENHGEETLCAPDGAMLGDDKQDIQAAFEAWLEDGWDGKIEGLYGDEPDTYTGEEDL